MNSSNSHFPYSYRSIAKEGYWLMGWTHDPFLLTGVRSGVTPCHRDVRVLLFLLLSLDSDVSIIVTQLLGQRKNILLKVVHEF